MVAKSLILLPKKVKLNFKPNDINISGNKVLFNLNTLSNYFASLMSISINILTAKFILKYIKKTTPILVMKDVLFSTSVNGISIISSGLDDID